MSSDIMMIDERVIRLIKKISINFYITFGSSIICGLLAHLYHFTNKLFNYDELGQTPAGFGAGVSLGRWGLQLIGDTIGIFFRTYSLPMINGLITLFFVAISACIIVNIFNIDSKVFCFLTGGIFSVFPTLVATYFFMFTAPYYGLALFLSCFSAYLIISGTKSYKNKKSKIIIGILFLTLAIAIYQSYCSVTICILLLDVIVSLYNDDEEIIEIVKRGIAYCVMLLFGLLLYFIGVKLSVMITGIQLDSYRGLNNMGKISLGSLVYSMKKCYMLFFFLATPKNVYQINNNILTEIMFLGIYIIVIYQIVSRVRLIKRTISKVALIGVLFLFPIAAMFPEILNHAQSSVSNLYTIMMYSVIFIIILPIILYCNKADICAIINNKIFNYINKNDLVGIVLSGIVFINILVYIWFANGNYQALQYTTYHDLAYFETIATQVKSIDGYSSEMKVALVGNGFDDPTFKAGSLMDDYFNIEGKNDTNINYFNNVYLWSRYLGYTPEIIEFKDSGYLKENIQVQKMPCYPNDGSIAIVGDTVVIKTSD